MYLCIYISSVDSSDIWSSNLDVSAHTLWNARIFPVNTTTSNNHNNNSNNNNTNSNTNHNNINNNSTSATTTNTSEAVVQVTNSSIWLQYTSNPQLLQEVLHKDTNCIKQWRQSNSIYISIYIFTKYLFISLSISLFISLYLSITLY
jgi:hypothetical protein